MLTINKSVIYCGLLPALILVGCGGESSDTSEEGDVQLGSNSEAEQTVDNPAFNDVDLRGVWLIKESGEYSGASLSTYRSGRIEEYDYRAVYDYFSVAYVFTTAESVEIVFCDDDSITSDDARYNSYQLEETDAGYRIYMEYSQAGEDIVGMESRTTVYNLTSAAGNSVLGDFEYAINNNSSTESSSYTLSESGGGTLIFEKISNDIGDAIEGIYPSIGEIEYSYISTGSTIISQTDELICIAMDSYKESFTSRITTVSDGTESTSGSTEGGHMILAGTTTEIEYEFSGDADEVDEVDRVHKFLSFHDTSTGIGVSFDTSGTLDAPGDRVEYSNSGTDSSTIELNGEGRNKSFDYKAISTAKVPEI